MKRLTRGDAGMAKAKAEAAERHFLKTAFLLDENNLDEEWKKQAAIYANFFRNYALNVKKKGETKREIRVRSADLNLKIREKPSSYLKGATKPTESAFESYIETDKEICRLNDELIDAEYNIALYGGAMEAMGHKKKALEYFGFKEYARYYSEPSARSFDAKVRRLIDEEDDGRKKRTRG